jgi:alkanesulfonate monooxygenase SsuD/methylene tetrahydromethanopterin reductase-like flavin-dependent oxidoreductase (luciferase family)
MSVPQDPAGRLAVALTPMETRREVVLQVAVRAEELGYEAFHLAEGWGHDAGVLLTEVALATRRIRLGTGVLNVWGRSAASLAMLARGLDTVSGGRFALGLGAGSPALAEGLHDVVFADPVGRLETVARQVRALLDGGRLAPSTPTSERPLRLAGPRHAPIPLQLAALGPRSVRLAGELADGWLPFLLPLSALKSHIGLLDEGAVRAGRAGAEVRPNLPVAVADDHRQAAELADWWIRHYLTRMGPLYRDTLRRLGFGPAVDAVLGGAAPPVELLDELTVHGDPTAAREALGRWRAAGAQLPVLVLPPDRPLAELDHVLTALAPMTRRDTP